MRRVLVLQAGSADAALRQRYGDYPAWFARLLGTRVALRVMRPYEEPLPPAAAFDGILMTGSPASVTAPEPWMNEAGAYLVEAARSRPVLGVCFGHQLVAHALGGRVERNPRGREAGTTDVTLTASGARDPLFAGVPPVFAAQQTHADHVPELPPGSTLLAANGFSPVQAFGVGESLRCVQFHPEMDAARSRLLNEGRRDLLDRHAPGGCDAVLASIREAPHASLVLTNWLDRFVGAPA